MVRFFKPSKREPDLGPHHAVTASGDLADAGRLSHYYTAITAGDRTFRDVNFKVATTHGAKGVFSLISAMFALKHAQDDDGNEPPDIDAIYSELESKQAGSIFSVWTGEAKWVAQIQVFMSWDMRGYDCEVSISPNDIEEDIFTMELFAEFLQSLLKAAGSEEYYVRYENVSWRFGDCSEDSGVVFSHRDIPL
jgi:hypothetical protein